jgi:hypothetical protein
MENYQFNYAEICQQKTEKKKEASLNKINLVFYQLGGKIFCKIKK